MTKNADLDDYLILRDAWIATHPAMRAARKAVRIAQDEADDVAQTLGDIYAAALEPPMPDEGRLSTDVVAETQTRKAARIEYRAALRAKLERCDVPLPTVTPAISALDGIDDEIAKLPPLQEHEIDLTLSAARCAGGASGTAALDGLHHPVIVVGLIVACKPNTFTLMDFCVGDKFMFYNDGDVPADMFARDVIGAGFRSCTLPSRCQVYLRFRNLTDDPTLEPIEIKVRVRSRHSRAELLDAPTNPVKEAS